MNPVLLSIILIPVLEIYLFIKIGTQIGAFNTILLPASNSNELVDGMGVSFVRKTVSLVSVSKSNH